MPSTEIRFLSARADSAGSPWQLIGLPYDGTSSYRRGAQFGPAEIRLASDSIESYSYYQNRDLEGLNFFDMGDLELAGANPEEAVNRISQLYAEKYRQGARLFGLGGDHTVTIGAVQGLVQAGIRPHILYLDAHLDLREAYTGGIFSHACVARRLLDLVGPDHLIQWGMRSGEMSEFEHAQRLGTYRENDLKSLHDACDDLCGPPIYLTLDLDLFDPAELPGVGNPEPGGLRFAEFLSFLPELGRLDVIGADVVELAPNWDSGGRSSVMAAEVIRELLLSIVK